jgi:hypoxanthine phosphoribosyltransferase
MHENLEKVLFHEVEINQRLDGLAAEITADYQGKELTVLAILNGSLIFMADLLRRIPLPLLLDCLRVRSYFGDMESSGRVEFDRGQLPELKRRHVLLLDDILDTGRTLFAIKRRIEEEAQPQSVRSCVLLRKRKPRAERVDADYVGFDIADEFVVGYGLDYQERYRNLPLIGVLKEPK